MSNIMNAKDAVSGSLCECFVTISGNRYNFMQAINLEASIEKTKQRFLFSEKLARVTNLQDGAGRAMRHFTITPRFSENCC